MLRYEEVPHRWIDSGSAPGFDLWLARPDSRIVVVCAAGDLDATTDSQFAEVLRRRLASAVDVIVVDMSRLAFLGVDALRTLARARDHARALGVALRLVTGPVCITRALRAASLAEHFVCYPDLTSAVSEPAGSGNGTVAAAC